MKQAYTTNKHENNRKGIDHTHLGFFMLIISIVIGYFAFSYSQADIQMVLSKILYCSIVWAFYSIFFIYFGTRKQDSYAKLEHPLAFPILAGSFVIAMGITIGF